QQPNANTPPEPPVSRIAPALASRYALNQATNQKNVALTKNLFSVKGQNGRSDYKMMVMAPDNLYLSIAGTNRDEIARLHQEIERAIPGLKLTAKNNLDQRLDGSQKLVVDYYVALNPPSQGAAGASFEEEDGDLAGALRRLAASSRIGGFSIKTGKQERDGNLTRTYYYIEGQGARSSVLSFIEGIAGEHPSVAFSKVSIFPPQSDRSMGSGALKTKITLLQYRLR
ncbi:MAG TPA: hypothetical protein PKV71_05800, partial [Calditrichia bacterium]|nr:hypothetical protein [Calditrichia bacterium]